MPVGRIGRAERQSNSYFPVAIPHLYGVPISSGRGEVELSVSKPQTDDATHLHLNGTEQQTADHTFHIPMPAKSEISSVQFSLFESVTANARNALSLSQINCELRKKEEKITRGNGNCYQVSVFDPKKVANVAQLVIHACL